MIKNSSWFKHWTEKLLLLVALLVPLAACETEQNMPTMIAAVFHDVSVTQVEQKVLPIILPVPGTVISKDRLKVASRISGFIEQINVDEGDVVEPGDVLLRIDDAQVEAAIKVADASVSAAKAELNDAAEDVNRFNKLVRTNIVAEDDLRNAKVHRAQAKATLATAEANLIAKRQDRRYSTIKSPVRARVRERYHDAGDLAAAGEVILQLDVLGALELEVYLPSTSLEFVAIGQTVKVQIDTVEQLLLASISSIVHSADAVSRRYKISLRLPQQPGLTPGLYGQAQFVLRQEAITVIPQSTITEQAGIEGVFVADEQNTLHFRTVRLGKRWGDLHEVLAGLEPGLLVVNNPTSKLRDGDRVR